jgi:hypothetical protein
MEPSEHAAAEDTPIPETTTPMPAERTVRLV